MKSIADHAFDFNADKNKLLVYLWRNVTHAFPHDFGESTEIYAGQLANVLDIISCQEAHEYVATLLNSLSYSGIILHWHTSESFSNSDSEWHHWYSFKIIENTSLSVIQSAEAALFTRTEAIRGDRTGYVYLISGGGFYKIGWAKVTPKRHKEITAKLPFDTEVLHTIKSDNARALESLWHRHFKGQRVRGEWFDLTNEDVAAFCAQSEMTVSNV